jgi:2-dehydropantoate 2-reductase
MKIAIVGCGALGSYYGARLLQQGADVHFLLRSDYDAVRQHGVRVQSFLGDFTAHPRCARSPEEIGVCDWVLIGLKTTANPEFQALLPPLVGPGTAICTLQNGLGNEDQLASLFPPAQIWGGLCYVCINRIGAGVIVHLAHGRIILGEYHRPASPRTHEFARRLSSSGVPCTVTDTLEQSHWEKLIWNIPFNGLGVAGAAGYEAVCQGLWQPGQPLGECLSTASLLADPRWESLVRELMHEVITAANAVGFPVDISLAEANISLTRKTSAYLASTLVDFTRHQPLELDSLFLEPLRQAQNAGIATPRLARLCSILEAMDAARH